MLMELLETEHTCSISEVASVSWYIANMLTKAATLTVIIWNMTSYMYAVTNKSYDCFEYPLEIQKNSDLQWLNSSVHIRKLF